MSERRSLPYPLLNEEPGNFQGNHFKACCFISEAAPGRMCLCWLQKQQLWGQQWENLPAYRAPPKAKGNWWHFSLYRHNKCDPECLVCSHWLLTDFHNWYTALSRQFFTWTYTDELQLNPCFFISHSSYSQLLVVGESLTTNVSKRLLNNWLTSNHHLISASRLEKAPV